jgi:predicted  nucleic acid-binding Zn-ribbon protein
VVLDEALRVRKSRSGEFLWFRRGGRAYIVTDTAILARGREILRPSLDLSRDHEAIRVRLQPFEAREREVDNEQDRLEERLERLGHREDAAADEERRRLEEQERALEARRRAIEADMRGIEDEERALEDRERAIEAVADAEIARLIDDALRRGLARPLR